MASRVDPTQNQETCCDPEYVNTVVPIDPERPTNFELNAFLQMVTHIMQCRFANCYLTGGPLTCRSLKAAFRHCRGLPNKCFCAMCRRIMMLLNRHMSSCMQVPIGRCPFAYCDPVKQFRSRRRNAQPSRAPPNSTATSSPQAENIPVHVALQPNNNLIGEIQQDSNVNAVGAMERVMQGSTSVGAPVEAPPHEESKRR